jgi:hypothetical protein
MWNTKFSLEQMRMNARIQPMTSKSRWKGKALFYFTIFGAAFAVTCLYLGMRPIMRLGGMVAAGGPYAIAHPAPSWVWILPVSIFLGMGCFFLNLFSSDPDGVNLMPLAWPGVFLSCGWNFLEFTFTPPGGGIAWGWLVCGVLFVLMGGLPLLLALGPAREKVRSRLQKGEGVWPYARQWLLVAAGIVAAVYFFKGVVG